MAKEFFGLIIVGSGLAGLSTAYYASQAVGGKEKSIAIITKEIKREASSFFAQGGLAAAVGKKDSSEKHFLDTMNAGHGLNNKKIARTLTERIPEQIKELQELGLKFDEELGLEGMHSEKRVMHINGDKTGYELSSFLLKLCKENDIKIIKAELLGLNSNGKEVNGLVVKENEEVREYKGNAFVLASGGYSGLWLNSTNPFAKGMAISKALKAGAELRDLEFQQFHPTTFENGKINFLISEAVRGEGALLVNEKGKRIAEGLEKKELSGRDEISRLIFNELKKEKVFLDCTEKENSFWEKRFPTVYNYLEKAGLKMGKDLIPVTPASHYSIGGIKTNEECRTTVKRLFAIGECSCNGLHGADRLASNSLSECIVFGKITAEQALKEKTGSEFKSKKIAWNEKGNEKTSELKKLMWNNAGIIRNRKGMENALNWIKNELKKDNDSRYQEQALLAGKIIESALKRKKSIGVHFRADLEHLKTGFGKHFD